MPIPYPKCGTGEDSEHQTAKVLWHDGVIHIQDLLNYMLVREEYSFSWSLQPSGSYIGFYR